MSPTSAPGSFLAALEALCEALSEIATGSCVIGGVAVIAHGVARHTADIDAVLLAEGLQLRAALRILARHGIAPRVEAAEAFARENQVLLLEHSSSGIPLDVSLGWLPFEASAVAAAVEVDYATVQIRVPVIADLIVYKLLASRPRDLDDVEKLVLLHGPRIDFDRARRALAPLCDALDDPTPLAALESARKLARPANAARSRATVARPKARSRPKKP